MDNLSYNYQQGTNRLLSVDDNVSSGEQSIDIDDQSENNYLYTKTG
jgi:hypothetical protein